MTHQFFKMAFTSGVKDVQSLMGSRKIYARAENGPVTHETLTDAELEFIAERDSFYMATVNETGWPYIQHRGGPKGFLRAISEHELAFADYAGNRQYISVGNLAANQRVALILVDYPNQARLKILGEARVIDSVREPDIFAQLQIDGYKARVERGFVIKVVAYDWNCPQHITPRWTADAIEAAVQPLHERIAELEAQLGKS